MIAQMASSVPIGAGRSPISTPKYGVPCRALHGSMPRLAWRGFAPTFQAGIGLGATVTSWPWTISMSATALSGAKLGARTTRGINAPHDMGEVRPTAASSAYLNLKGMRTPRGTSSSARFWLITCIEPGFCRFVRQTQASTSATRTEGKRPELQKGQMLPYIH